MSLIITSGAQISNTLWRSKIEDVDRRCSVSRVWLKRHLYDLSICGVFLLLRGFKAFKRFCIWAMSSPLKHPTFAGSKRSLARAMVLSPASILYLHHSTTPYLCVQKSDTNVLCCCFDKYFKNCVSTSVISLKSVQKSQAICRIFWEILYNDTNPNKMGNGACLRLCRGLSCLSLESL